MSGEGQTSEGHAAIRRLKDDVKDGKATCGTSIENTEQAPLQAVVGVRVVACLLGHSRLGTLCSGVNTQVGQWGHDSGNVAGRPGQEYAEEIAPTARKKGIG